MKPRDVVYAGHMLGLHIFLSPRSPRLYDIPSNRGFPCTLHHDDMGWWVAHRECPDGTIELLISDPNLFTALKHIAKEQLI